MVSGATLTDSVAEQLLHAVQQCTGLEALVLRQFIVDDDSQQTVPAVMAAVASLPRLQQLKLYCLWLPSMAFRALHSCTVLHELTLEGGQTPSTTPFLRRPCTFSNPFSPLHTAAKSKTGSFFTCGVLHAGFHSLEDNDLAFQTLCEGLSAA